MSVDLNNNSFYAEFKDARPSWALVGCALSLGIIAVFGMTFNFCVIFVTIRSKGLFCFFVVLYYILNNSFWGLNGTANYLLALCSFFELLHQHGHFLFVFTAISGQNFIEYRTAAMITSLSVFGMGGIAISMFFTGIDRLFCVVAAEMHSKIDKRLYLGTITIICAIFCAVLIYTLYLTAQLLAGVMITGCIADIVQGPSGNFFVTTTLYINLVTSAVYAIVGIAVRMKTASSIAQSATNRRILRSLSAIIALNMGGYFLNTGYMVFLRPAVIWPVTAWFWEVITAIPLNISAASNGPILYFTSSEYRREFHSAFPRVFQKASKPTQKMLKTITLKRKVADMPKN